MTTALDTYKYGPGDPHVVLGKFFRLTLTNMFINIPLISQYDKKERAFTILGITFENLLDQTVETLPTDVVLIDTDGFQHRGNLCEYHEFIIAMNPISGLEMEVKFPWPDLELYSRAKTKGWVWFEALENNTLPKRLIFNFRRFEPGQTSGFVKEKDVVEVVFLGVEKET